ncbi:MAG TPA: MoxR family ATPase [Savagea sp.]
MPQTFGFIPSVPYLWEDVIATASLNKPILLKGPTGSGKTKFAESIAEHFNQPVESVNCSVDLDAESLLGFKTLVVDKGISVIEFVEGPVVKAMKQGHILYIDEINMAKPETLPVLHSALDYRRMLTNPFTGEVIQAHPDFKVIAAINEGYIGTMPMNEALKNRFIAFQIDYLEETALQQLLSSRYTDIPAERLEEAVKISIELQKQVKQGLLAEQAASIRSLLDAIDLSNDMPFSRALHYSIIEKLEDPLERRLVEELIDMWVS